MATVKYADLNSLSRFKTNIENEIPTKTSDLTNDSGFVTDEISIGTTQPTNDEKIWINPDDVLVRQDNIVKTTYNESDDNTYSTNYINNAFGGKILWTNPNPTSSFAAQTITLNSDDYDMYEIVWRRQSTSTNYGYLYNTGKIPYNMISVTGKQVISNGSVFREYSVTNKTTITFQGGYNSGTNDNSYAVPIYIIGYKTGLFN